MKTKKQIAVWLDHSEAHLIKPDGDNMISSSIKSENADQVDHRLNKNADLMHDKEQQDATDYYKEIKSAIKDNEEILLFGPTTAKDELSNILKADQHFYSVKIDVKDTDYLTKNQQNAFVKEHFELK